MSLSDERRAEIAKIPACLDYVLIGLRGQLSRNPEVVEAANWIREAKKAINDLLDQ